MFQTRSIRFILISTFILIGLINLIFIILTWDLPSLNNLSESFAVPSTQITDRHGRILYEVLDPRSGSHIPVPFETIPEFLKLATIATEDQNFYENPGIDIIGIARALWINIKGGSTVAGGSTITQQVARNLLLSEDEQFERTIRRKLRESWLAWQLTKKISKDEILELYLNQMYYGALSYGVEAAAHTYFSKSVTDLDLAESALIAGLPQGPAIFNPLVNPEAAKNRQSIVLELMKNQGIITKSQYEQAIKQPMEYSPTPYPIEAPHFVMMANAISDQIQFNKEWNPNQALIIKTTLDLDLQHLAERAIEKHLESLHENKSEITSGGAARGFTIPGGHNVNNASLVALDPSSGEILAMVGSPNFFDTENAGAINMALVPRQPGSALKPILYAAALDPARSDYFTAGTMLLDVRTTFITNDENVYTPANFDNLEHGPVSVREALASSLNIPAVITLEHIGIDEFIDLATQLGITTLGDPRDYDLSLALGGGEVTLLELSSAYASFARGGYRLDPVSILEIRNYEGKILYRNPATVPVQVLDQRVSWLISDILNDNSARAIGFSTNSALKIDRPAAVKTGTTTNFHDNWTIGYTPDLVVGVWVGNANHEPMRGVSGLTGAGPIWHQFIREALIGTPEHWFDQPEGFVQVEICEISGYLPTEVCPFTKNEWFIKGTEPTIPDHVYKKVWIDSLIGHLANADTPPDRRLAQIVLDLPPIAHSWARSQGLVLFQDLQGKVVKETSILNDQPLQIISPSNYSRFRIDNFVDSHSQRLHIEAVGAIELIRVDIWLDDNLIISFDAPPYETWWTLIPGTHTCWAEGTNANGEIISSAVSTFEVEQGK